ncbi:hypothetical protein D3C73_1357830 [compost metagenome]
MTNMKVIQITSMGVFGKMTVSINSPRSRIFREAMYIKYSIYPTDNNTAIPLPKHTSKISNRFLFGIFNKIKL